MTFGLVSWCVSYGSNKRLADTASGGSPLPVITIQRVRVRWSAAGRGAPSANTRRGLDSAVALPTPLPPDDVVVHEVLATEADGYTRHDEVLAGGLEQAREVGLWLA